MNYYNKIINSRCVCGFVIPQFDYETVLLWPCEHIFHRKCIKGRKECSICNTKIKEKRSEKYLKKNRKKSKLHYQQYVDLIALKNLDNKTNINYDILLSRLPHILNLGFELINNNNNNNDDNKPSNFIKNLIKVANIKINIIGKENIIDCKKVIITNHSSRMDFIPIYHKFKTNFLSSKKINESIISHLTSKMLDLFVIERGKKNNSVKKIKEYINEGNTITINPEGFISHPKILTRFRTGAFNLDVPIQPIIIEYDKLIRDSDIFNCILKLLSQESITYTLKILPLEYPPFDDNKIEKIRRKMAKTGKMYLSRVSNRDIIDE